jgi:hypothetical protein
LKIRILVGVLLAAAPLASAAAMPVSTFLAKADRLQRKGPMAMFSGDLRLLTRQIKADGAQLRAANKAAAAAGRPKAYCTPEGRVKMNNRGMPCTRIHCPTNNLSGYYDPTRRTLSRESDQWNGQRATQRAIKAVSKGTAPTG